MNDRMLAAFAAAQRTGSFSIAAWELSTTQQNISYSIRKLEEELGFPLFVRRSNRVELTAGGEDFLAWYRALDSGAEQLAAEGTDAVPKGVVTDTQVRCFITVAREGSVADAAETLFYAPQTLSDHLTALEKALGATLFRRDPSGWELTAKGWAYWQLFENAASSLEAVSAYARERYEAGRNTAVVGLSEWLDADGVLKDALDAFDGEASAQVMTNYELLEALEAGAVDLVLWSGGHAPVNRGFEVRAVGDEELCLLTPADKTSCPLLVCPGWPRSFLENRAITTQETSFGDFTPSGVLLVESFAQLRERMASGQYAAVTDRRFGALAGLDGMNALPLGTESQLTACRRTNAGEDCAARLITHLATFFGGDTK